MEPDFSGSFNGLHELEELFLHKSNMSQLQIGAFNGLYNLEWLQLDNNQITSLPANIFSHLKTCELLILKHHQIFVIEPGAFNGLSSLNRLALDNNYLTEIQPESFNGLSSLKVLYLQRNSLTTLDSSVLTPVPRPLNIAMSDPWESGDKTWDCPSLCWMKTEEQAGTIGWHPFGFGAIFKPKCSDGSNWDDLKC